MTKNVKGLLEALRQSINEAILESSDVAAAMAALKRTGMCPLFTVDTSLVEVPAAEPGQAEALVLSDEDVEFLAALGIADPSWSRTAPEPVRHSTE